MPYNRLRDLRKRGEQRYRPSEGLVELEPSIVSVERTVKRWRSSGGVAVKWSNNDGVPVMVLPVAGCAPH